MESALAFREGHGTGWLKSPSVTHHSARRPCDGINRTDAIIGKSPAIRRVLEQMHQVAATDATVLLLGETGTGKELFATEIHQQSARRGRAMVRVNCAAIPSTLVESE